MLRRPPCSPLFPTTPLFRPRGTPTASVPLRRRADRRVRRRLLLLRRTRRRHGPALGVRALRLRGPVHAAGRSEEHTSELQSRQYLVCRLLLEKKNKSTKLNT